MTDPIPMRGVWIEVDMPWVAWWKRTPPPPNADAEELALFRKTRGKEAGEHSFITHAVPGMVVELADGRRLLLGHCNDAGQCGTDEDVIADEAVIHRYRMLDWEAP